MIEDIGEVKSDFIADNLDTLQKYGSAFQSKAIAALLTDREFMDQSHDIIVPHYFESEPDKWIVETTLWYYHEYKALPTLEVFKQELDKIERNDALRSGVIDSLKTVYAHTKSLDLDYIKNEFLTFCKQQSVKNAVLRSADLLQRGKYDEIKSIIDRAMRAGQERNVGHKYNEELVTRITKLTRPTIPTPWSVINDIMDGGLGPGELGCVMAPSGVGKSWILRAIGAEALRRGKKVVDYTFELSDTYVGLRYDSVLSGIEPSKIRDHKDEVQHILDGLDGQLIIKYFPTRSATVSHLSAHINKLIQSGFVPDLVIIDYADLMRSIEKASAKHEELGFIYEEIRGMLGELQIPGWTATQSHRSSIQDDIIESDKIAGAYGKIMVSDFVMSASRKLEDRMSNTARFYVNKNRFGPDGLKFPAVMDLVHGKVEIYDENTPQGIQINKQMLASKGSFNSTIQQTLKKMFNNDVEDDEIVSLD